MEPEFTQEVPGKSDRSPKPVKAKVTGHREKKVTGHFQNKVTDLADFKRKVTGHFSAGHSSKSDRSLWKESREKPGHLIRRIKGYDIVEETYGVKYLYVVDRSPKKTSADFTLYEHAGYFTWAALEKAGRVVKNETLGGKHERTKRVAGHSNRAS